jgi:hypothetical protein
LQSISKDDFEEFSSYLYIKERVMSLEAPRGGCSEDIPTRVSLWRIIVEVRGYTWLDYVDGKW